MLIVYKNKQALFTIHIKQQIIFLFVIFMVLNVAVYADDLAGKADPEPGAALDQRIRIERKTRYQPFVMTSHKPNYILPITYNKKPNNAPLDTSTEDELDRYEVKFQFSMKYPLIENMFGEQGSLQLAYTNLSFWQAYNENASSPFRETDHEPEVFFIFPNEWTFMRWNNRLIQLGLVHQSNGRSGEQSRSWNRFYADFIFQYGNCYLSLKPWYQLGGAGSGKLENPDIENYMGHGEARMAYVRRDHTVSIMLRNNFHSPNYGAFEFNWSFSMTRRVKWFMQYFEGYGESLIDYNARVNRVGVGIAFTDWL